MPIRWAYVLTIGMNDERDRFNATCIHLRLIQCLAPAPAAYPRLRATYASLTASINTRAIDRTWIGRVKPWLNRGLKRNSIVR
jgi:hypothetical protein